MICPCCGGNDRERWLKDVIKNHTNIMNEPNTVLHIAPERPIERMLREENDVDYYSGNIVCGKADHVVDITNIKYPDNMYDWIIVNHVLEHIRDEAKALAEMKRVLKDGGRILMSFPICTDMDTQEDINVINPEECLRRYGQKDHVRLYGKDFKKRIEEYGFKVMTYSPKDIYTKEECLKRGYIYDDITIIARVSG